MADTLRTLSALQTLLADNTAGDISAQDIRDFLVSVYPTGRVLLASQTASSSSTVDFTSRNAPFQSGDLFQSDYDEYEISFLNVRPATTDTLFVFQVSTDAGSTWKTDSSSYFYAAHWTVNAPADGAFNDSSFSSTYGLIGETISNSTTYQGLDGTLRVCKPLGANNHKWLSKCCWVKNSGQMAMEEIFILSAETSGVNALRFKMASGNVASGDIRVYGLCK